MPYELAQEVGWTPKVAFESIRHLDWPWQLVYNIKPKDVGSDIDDLEWDNVPQSQYEGTATPAQVRAQLEVARYEEQQAVAAEVSQSSESGPVSTLPSDSVVFLTPAA